MTGQNEIAEFICTQCGFQLFHPIGKLNVSTLGLYDDARFPGRCLLALDQHQEDLVDLQIDLAERFLRDMRTAAIAIRNATGADRINYAILGNAEPHLHCHLIPRKKEGDPIATRAPWAHPDPVTPLAPTLKAKIVSQIRLELSSIV